MDTEVRYRLGPTRWQMQLQSRGDSVELAESRAPRSSRLRSRCGRRLPSLRAVRHPGSALKIATCLRLTKLSRCRGFGRKGELLHNMTSSFMVSVEMS